MCCFEATLSEGFQGMRVLKRCRKNSIGMMLKENDAGKEEQYL
jgi:hypothetical protein